MKFTFGLRTGSAVGCPACVFVFYVTPRCCRGWNGSLITDHRAKKRGHACPPKTHFQREIAFQTPSTHPHRKDNPRHKKTIGATHRKREERQTAGFARLRGTHAEPSASREVAQAFGYLSVSRGRAGTTVNPGTPNPGQATFGSTYEDQAATVPTKRLLLAPSIFQACSTSQRRLSVSVVNSNTAASKCGRRTARSRRQVSLERSSMPRTPRRRSTAFRNEVRPSISNSTGAAASHTRPKQASTGSTTSRNLCCRLIREGATVKNRRRS